MPELDLDAIEQRMAKLVNVAGATVQTAPETVLALIARIRELEAKVAEWKELYEANHG